MRSRIDKTRVALSIALPALFVTVSRTDAQRIGEGPRSIYQNGCKGIPDLTSEAIDAAMAGDDEQPLAKLNRCDDSYHRSTDRLQSVCLHSTCNRLVTSAIALISPLRL